MSHEATEASPERLFGLSVAYWQSCVLFAAIDLGLFERLAVGPLTTVEIEQELGVPRRSAEMLVESAAALALIIPQGDGWRNSDDVSAFLVSERPGYMGETILFNARSYAPWGELAAALRKAGPTIKPEHFLGDDEGATRNFVLAMHNRAMGVARCLVRMLDLQGRKRLLDVGGGPATYSRLLVEAHPELHSTVMDLPGVLAVATELLGGSTARDRVELRPGNMFTDDFGSGFDAVLISGVMHRTEEESTVAILKKAAAALEPGGLLAISDLFTGANTAGPVLPELFSLHMLVTADSGRSLPLPKMEGYLAEAGFRMLSFDPYPPPLPHALCLAERMP
jgi:SAM-dependent methyltransferase